MAERISTDHLSRDDLEEMQNWVPPVEDKNLIETGRKELHQIGADLVQRFPEICQGDVRPQYARPAQLRLTRPPGLAARLAVTYLHVRGVGLQQLDALQVG